MLIYPWPSRLFKGTGGIIWLTRCQWSNLEIYRSINHMNSPGLGVTYGIMYVLEWRIVYALTTVLFWCAATMEINTKITLEWAHKQFVTRGHTLFYYLHVITIPWITTKATIFTYRSSVSLAWFTFRWWRHNWLLMTSHWPDNCDAITWIMISNSLNIDFIHDDIHGRSCKNK